MIGSGYELTKAFYAEVEQNEAMQTNCKAHHQSLYTWICELRNRTKREVVDLPVLYTMQMSFIGSQHTLAKAIDDLADWGIIEVIMKTKGQGTKVKLAIAFLQKHCNYDAITNPDAIAQMQLLCNSSAITVQTTKTNKRNKPSKTTPAPQSPQGDEVTQLVAGFCYQSEAFKMAWRDWEQFRRELKKPLKPRSVAEQLKLLAQHSESEAIAIIGYSICNSYQGLFPPKANARTGTSTSTSLNALAQPVISSNKPFRELT